MNATLAILALLVTVLLAWRAAAAIRTARDARRHGWSRLASLGWAASAVVYPAWYWWQGRLGRLAPDEARALLEATARAHRLTGAAGVAAIRCPLCDTEIPNA